MPSPEMDAYAIRYTLYAIYNLPLGGSNPPHDDDEPPETRLKDKSAGVERSHGEMLGSSTTRMMTVRLFFRIMMKPRY